MVALEPNTPPRTLAERSLNIMNSVIQGVSNSNLAAMILQKTMLNASTLAYVIKKETFSLQL